MRGKRLCFTEEEKASFQKLLKSHRGVSVLSHVHPDPDAIGTALGIASIFKEQGIRVEVANATEELPRRVDFLFGFERIKKKIDFSDSLILACDCGSIDRLGFDVTGRAIVNIDHHLSNTRYGTLNLIREKAASSSEVAYRFFETMYPIPKAAAEAFYAALISDTRYFTVGNVTQESFELARELIALGVDPSHVAQQMLQRRSLASLRILGKALESLRLYLEGKVGVMIVTREDFAWSGARDEDLDGLVDYARSLVTVEIAILIVERERSIKVSLRSKGADVMCLAQDFGGGGHHEAAGFETTESTVDDLLERMLRKIKEGGFAS